MPKEQHMVTIYAPRGYLEDGYELVSFPDGHTNVMKFNDVIHADETLDSAKEWFAKEFVHPDEQRFYTYSPEAWLIDGEEFF